MVSAPIRKLLQFDEVFVIFTPIQIYVYENSRKFTPHSIALNAGCEIYDVIKHDFGYITISDEASFRYSEIP